MSTTFLHDDDKSDRQVMKAYTTQQHIFNGQQTRKGLCSRMSKNMSKISNSNEIFYMLFGCGGHELVVELFFEYFPRIFVGRSVDGRTQQGVDKSILRLAFNQNFLPKSATPHTSSSRRFLSLQKLPISRRLTFSRLCVVC